jgi:alpha-tubulin suppressor-like RCC1 family protein
MGVAFSFRRPVKFRVPPEIYPGRLESPVKTGTDLTHLEGQRDLVDMVLRARAGKVAQGRERMAALLCALALSALPLSCEQGAEEPQLVTLTGVRELVSALHHTCVLLDSGRAACWGLNDLGQLATQPSTGAFDVLDPLGIATTEEAYYNGHAAVIEPLAEVRQVATGDSHVCALLGDQTVSCWGDAGGGQLGAGDFSEHDCEGRPCNRRPVLVPGLEGVTELSLGGFHSCALDGAGRLRCWGSLAVGVETESLSTCDGMPCATEPVRVPAPGQVVQVVSGFSHACMLLAEGEVRCWGVNALGSVGVVSPRVDTGFGVSVYSNVELPARVELPLPATALFAAGSGFYSCAVLQDGALYCWGENTYGQLGAGEPGESCPEGGGDELYCSVTPLASGFEQQAELYAFGELHACAVTADGELYCWGYGARGQLGLEVELLSECADGRLCSPSPQLVPTESRTLDVAVGSRFTCVLQEDERVLCWGWGNPKKPVEDPEAQRLDCVFSDTPCQVEPSWEGSPERIFITQYDKLCVLTSEKELHCVRKFKSGSRVILMEPLLVEE